MNIDAAEFAQQFTQLQRDVQILKDIEAIKRLKHAYFRGIDSADLELLAGIFHKDVTVHFIGGSYEWKLNGREEYLESIANSFNADVVSQHNGHHPEIDILSETEATGIWYLHDIFYQLAAPVLVQGTAFYKDRYIKEDGRWWLYSTYYKRHYEIVEPIAGKVPNFTMKYLAEHGRKLA
jgi:hypothetical protein